MFASHLVLTAVALLAPQGGLGPVNPGTASYTVRPHVLSYPADSRVAKFAPHVDAGGAPVARTTLAAGAADFDADGNRDLWFLGDAGSAGARLSVQMARTSDLGRFRAWHEYAARPWTDAATYRAPTFYDRVIATRPDAEYLVETSYSIPLPPADPRSGTWGHAFGQKIGRGAFEIEAFDDAGDGIDDLVLLFDTGKGSTVVKKLRPGRSAVALELPARLSGLQLLDYDGDGRSDPLVQLPGGGAVLLRDTGAGAFAFAQVWLFAGIRDVAVGDVDGDGRDDVALAFGPGVVAYRSTAAGFVAEGLPNPSNMPGVGAAAILGPTTANGRGVVVAVAQNGQSFALHRFANGRLIETLWRTPPDPTEYSGAAPTGLVRLRQDVDGDGDLDLVVQLPGRTHWATLPNSDASLAPQVDRVDSRGLVGETGYFHQRLWFRAPPEALAAGLTHVEFAIYLNDVNLGRWIYWTRAIGKLDASGRVVFDSYYQTGKPGFRQMLRDNATSFAGGVTCGGDTLLSIHFKQAPTAANGGPKRRGSTLLHEKGGDHTKSAQGVKWRFRAAPPKPTADTELLPWD